MVTNGEKKKKKTKNRPYDVDESKKVFLYAYEQQLLNEKINWKKAEELKITKHSAASMRSHYMNQIKHENSLYLEMYPDEVSEIFAKVKKMKRMKKVDGQTKNLSITNNLKKQTSNISLNRLVKCSSIGAGFNKMNSLSVDKLFSSTYIKNKNKRGFMLGSFGEATNKKIYKEGKKKRKMEGGKEEINEENKENENENKKQETIGKDGEVKKRKVDTKKNKKKKKQKEKDKANVILKSSINKTHKTLATEPPKKLIAQVCKAEEEKKKTKGAEKEISKKVGLIKTIEENKAKEISEINEKENVDLKKSAPKEEASEKIQTKIKIKKEIKIEKGNTNSALLNNIQNTDQKQVNENLETSESNVVNTVGTEEKKKGAIASIFNYIFKKIFR